MKVKKDKEKKATKHKKTTNKKKHKSDVIKDKKDTNKRETRNQGKKKKDTKQSRSHSPLPENKKDVTEHKAGDSSAEHKKVLIKFKVGKIKKDNSTLDSKIQPSKNSTSSTMQEKSINEEQILGSFASVPDDKHHTRQLSSTLRNAAISKYASMCEDIATGKVKTKETSNRNNKASNNVMQNKDSQEKRVPSCTAIDLDQINLPVQAKPSSTCPKAILKNVVGSITQSVLATAQNFYPQIPKSFLYPVSSGATLPALSAPASVHTTVRKSIGSTPITTTFHKAKTEEKPAVNLRDIIAKQSEEISNIQQLVWMRSEYNKMLAQNPSNYDAILEKSVVDFKIQEWEKSMAQNKPKMVKKNGIYVVESPYDLPQDYMMLPHNYQPSEYALKLMAKMGWNQGKTLGKDEKDLQSVPALRVEIKNDRIGLGTLGEIYSADPELRNTLSSKNPISALQELCQKNKWPIPEYAEISVNPFVTKVTIKGRSFVPTTKSHSKKNAKCEAARYALECMGFKTQPTLPDLKPHVCRNTVQTQNLPAPTFQPRENTNFTKSFHTQGSINVCPPLNSTLGVNSLSSQMPLAPRIAYPQVRGNVINTYNQQQIGARCSHQMTANHSVTSVFGHPSPSVITHSSLATQNGGVMPQQHYNNNIVRPPLPPHMLINQWNKT